MSEELNREPADAFGGPDCAHESFTDTQKAISYSMTSFFTTGGIRGGKKKLDKFYPRSFNMGIRRDVYQELGGFSKMRFGEDIDFSIRIFKAGNVADSSLRHGSGTSVVRTSASFWKQVYNSGIARINLYKKYPESLKLVHLLPMVFTVGTALLVLMILFGLFLQLFPIINVFGSVFVMMGLMPLVLYSVIICVDSTMQNNSLNIGLLSIEAAFIQLTGYGCGFISAWWKRCVCGMDEFSAYEKNFYK